jgi:hypothetical protein
MSRTRSLVAGAFGLYALLHLVIIGRSHIPWFDDTFFASIADTLRRTGEFRLAVSPLWFGKPVYLYGPTYFLLVAGLFDTLGFGVLQYRLTGLVAALAVVLAAYRILRREGVGRGVAVAGCTLIALDPVLLEILRVGRMDLLAILFFLLAYLFLLDSRHALGRAGVLYSALSGAAAALGVLTTPRPGYLLIPLGLILLYRCYAGPTARRIAQIVAWAAGFAPLCIAWIAYAFGGVAPMLAYFSEFTGTYAGAGFATITIQKPLLVLLLLFGLVVVIKNRRAFLDEFALFCGLGIALFFLFVKNTPPFGGGYSILLIPFEYMGLAWLISNCPPLPLLSTPMVQRLAFLPLFLLNGLFFLAIVASDVLLWPSLDPTEAARVISADIPSGSRVIGDDKFYFLVRRAGSDFQYLERGGTLAERVAFHKNTYDFEYLITDMDEQSTTMDAYRASTDLVKVGAVDHPTLSSLIRYPLWIRGHLIMWGVTLNYGGSIYKRVR